ncbi:MAG: putative entry exclusion protein TrbK-alt [Bradyrhizobium sp.]|nr:putative entry exclusion protein TrbK-alt [Pseudomonadota bacterium]MDE2472955.1 putative entry exclusion protein TrbK-alt [Bradyrhizobium sp.]
MPTLAAVLLVVLTIAACAIRLRGDEVPTNAAVGSEVAPDPLATKLSECRSVTDQQKDALAECRKRWAEQRRRFLGQSSPALTETGDPQSGPSLFVAPKDESRLPPGYPSIQQRGKE